MPKVLLVDDNVELLALLASALGEAGYAVLQTQRGRGALDQAKRERPDFAVVDVLLPDMLGYEVAEAFRRQRLPFAFMSGVHKGGRSALEAISQYGAVAYFEKPFERKALLSLLSERFPARPSHELAQAWDVAESMSTSFDGPTHAIEMTGRVELISGDTQASIQGERLVVRPALRSSPGLASSSPGRAPSGPGLASSSPGRAPSAPGLASSTPGPTRPTPIGPRRPTLPPYAWPVQPPTLTPTHSPAPTQTPTQSPTPTPTPTPTPWPSPTPTPTPSPSPSPWPTPPPPPPPFAAPRGELRDNLPQLFAAFHQTQETGELGLQRGLVKKVVYFDRGMPVFAFSNLAQDRLGQFLVRAGRIDKATFEAAAAEAKELRIRTGDRLIQRGLLTEQERLYFIGQQVKSILYSLFLWEEGSYQLSFQERARQESIKLDLHPATLVLRSVKKLWKEDRLARILAPGDRLTPGQDPLFPLAELELQGWEASLIARCNGARPVEELVASAKRPLPDALATLVALASMRILVPAGS